MPLFFERRQRPRCHKNIIISTSYMLERRRRRYACMRGKNVIPRQALSAVLRERLRRTERMKPWRRQRDREVMSCNPDGVYVYVNKGTMARRSPDSSMLGDYELTIRLLNAERCQSKTGGRKNDSPRTQIYRWRRYRQQHTSGSMI